MPVNKSGRIVKIRKGKGGTLHQKNHRWESFTTKISKLSSLSATKTVRRHEKLDANEETAANASYLKSGLERWLDSNMAGVFVDFAHNVLPMCDSLAQIVHHEEKIFAEFVSHIEKGERGAWQPLLELMVDFAHDLGSRFEKFYAKALEMAVSVAATQDVQVIDWSFTCLAFMFKYLSKLLVPDLRPTYDLMAPILGKYRTQPHTARQAAEAMSFLIKKAGAPSNKSKALPLIVSHAKKDLESIRDTKEYGLYYNGLMTMFAESMKTINFKIHTSGPAIFEALVLVLDEEDFQSKNTSPWMDVVCGVLTSMVHHTQSHTFGDILGVVLRLSNAAVDEFVESKTGTSLNRVLFSARTIGIAAGVRKGTRVSKEHWPRPNEQKPCIDQSNESVLGAMCNILKSVSKHGRTLVGGDGNLDVWHSLVLSASITMQYAPTDGMLRFISPFMDTLTKEPLANWFLTFSSYFSEAEPGWFRSMALPYFQRFVAAHWSDSDNGDTLSVLIPEMISSGVLSSKHGKDGFILPQSWQDQIVSKFERLEVSPFPEQASPYNRSPTTWHDRCLPKYNALLDVLESTKVHPSTDARIAEILHRKLKLALRPSSSLAPEEANFIVGRGFSAFVRMSKAAGEIDRALEPLLRAAAPRYARLPSFLEALLDYETSLKESPKPKAALPSKDSSSEYADLLVTSLVSNLSTSSHDLRLLSLRLLNHLYTTEQCTRSEALELMISVEQTDLDLQTERTIGMQIRRLGPLFIKQTTGSWLTEAIPAFCFGMLTVRYAKVWEEAGDSLKQISESKTGEAVVAKTVFDWLETSSTAWDYASRNVEKLSNNGLTDFECSNLMKVDELSKSAEERVIKARDKMLQRFADAQELVPARPSQARAQALRVLAAAPGIAEKRSRQLIPMFLSWASKQCDEDTEQNEDNDNQGLSDWTRKDQKSQLDLFGLFTNPKSLYKSVDVYNALLRLLTNGDIEIQKSALKAVFVWKSSSIKPYEENLLNLVDESRFKEEITILLQGQTLIQAEHRPALMPILLRILYGRSISHKGAASGRQGMEATRLTILRNLGSEFMGDFLDIAIGELNGVQIVQHGILQDTLAKQEILSVRKQRGFMEMMECVLKELGTKARPFAQRLLDAILYCVVYSSRQLQDAQENHDDSSDNATHQISMLKDIRQGGLKCLNMLFMNAPDFAWAPYISTIVKETISPRLENLPVESAQSVSIILRILSTWAASPHLVLFLNCNINILPKVADCLAQAKSKDEVKLFVLAVIGNIVQLCHNETETPEVAAEVKKSLQILRQTEGVDSADSKANIRDILLTPNIDHFLTQIGGVLQSHHDISRSLLEACVQSVSKLAPLVSSSTQARNLVDISVYLLDQPSRRVKPCTKTELLLILKRFVELYKLHTDTKLKDKVYNTITSLFGFFRDKTSREVLSEVLKVYSDSDPTIAEIADICIDLNSFKGLDEPDYNRRQTGYTAVDTKGLFFTPRQWQPLLFNMLYYIRDDSEHAILSGLSSDAICKFVSAAGSVPDQVEQSAAFMQLLSNVLLPALFAGAKDERVSEVVRREYLKIMASIVRTFPKWSEVSDMRALLGEGDESSFFSNLLDIGLGKRSAALGKLAAASERGQLSGKNVSHFLIPTIEHFILDRAEGNDAHNLAAETTTVVGVLASSMEWPQYRAMLKRFLGYIHAKPELGKQITRLIGKVTDALALAANENNATLDVDMEEMASAKERCTLSRTMPRQEKLTEDLAKNFIPPLSEYLHHKDESTVSDRVPIAVIVVRLLRILPQEEMNARLPAVLTPVCQILRSKAIEARRMARDTLTKICVLIGPSCFGFVLKELKGALARGYQLHVLSYTMHEILVATIDGGIYGPGELDYCLPQIVNVIMDDIFGATGQEKDAEEYVSKMAEVKSSKSHDSMELIARKATLSHLTVLIKPIQQLLKERLTEKLIRKIDELLIRVQKGLEKNEAAATRDSLIFCYEVVRDVNSTERPEKREKVDSKLKKYLLQKGAKKSGQGRGITSVRTHMLVRFAFDVLRAIVKKNPGLCTPGNLVGWVPILGDAVIGDKDDVKAAAFQVLTIIIRVKNTGAYESTDLYRIAVLEATKSMLENTSINSALPRAALDLISKVLSQRPEVEVKNNAVDKLLLHVKGDMDEPESKDLIFKFVRSVLDAQVHTDVVYDILDHVGEIMITNHDKGTRDLARGSYVHFITTYPQMKKRWKKQLNFIIANLEYEREGGRLQILEVINILIKKLSRAEDVDFAQEVLDKCFVPLINILANDDSEMCRLEAGERFKQIFREADDVRTARFLGMLRMEVINEDPKRVRITMKLWALYYQSQKPGGDVSDVSMLIDNVYAVLRKVSSDTETLIDQALQLSQILASNFPSRLFASKTKEFWIAVRACLSYPHAAIKLSAAKLMNLYFTDFASYNKETGLGFPINGSAGLNLKADDLADLIRRTARLFKTPLFRQELADEVVKMLVFLARCAGANCLPWKAAQDADDEEDQAEGIETKSAVEFMCSVLSSVLRRETSPPRYEMLLPKIAALDLLDRIIRDVETAQITPSLQTILLPLHSLTDPSIAAPYSTHQDFRNAWEKLRQDSDDIMEKLKRRVGIQVYSENVLKVREGVRARRMARSSKRKVEAVTAPERFGDAKRKKGERKKEKRKERGQEHRNMRHEG